MTLSLLIVVLHYSGVPDTLACLASLAGEISDAVHVVVINNGSGEHPRAAIAATYPWAEIIDLPENLGWSGGNNVGIRLAQRRGYNLVCLLNNDTIVRPGTIARLLQTAAALGPCLLHPLIYSYGRADEAQLDPTLPHPPDMRATPAANLPGVFAIDMVNGACLLAFVAVFDAIGLIDERFFLLCEDADLGRRAQAGGFTSYCDTAALIEHKESRAFGGKHTPIKTYYGLRNTLLYHEKRGGIRHWPRILSGNIVWTIGNTARADGLDPRTITVLLAWFFSRRIYARAVRMALRDYVFRRFGRLNCADEAILKAAPAADAGSH